MIELQSLRRAGLGIAVAVGMATASVSAGAVTVFDLTGGGGNLGQTEDFGPIDGITVSVEAFKDGGLGTAGDIHQNGNGIGVAGNPEGGRLAGNEQLTFTFDPTQTQLLEGLVFERGQFDEHFNLFDAAGLFVQAFVVDGSNNSGPGSDSFQTFDFSVHSLIGGFSVRGVPVNGDENNEGVRIASLTVQQVPAPAALPLLATALIGVGLLTRRRRGRLS